MTCSSCKNLDEKKKLEGKVSGCKYYCNKNKCYVCGDMPKCKNHQRAYSRDNITCDKIYEEGKDFYNEDHSPLFYLVIIAVVVILLIIARITSPELFG